LRVLSDSEFAVLRSLANHQLLTAEQVCRLFFSYPGSLRYAQDMLKRLCEGDHLLLRSYVPKPNPGGRARYIWRLSQSGRRLLAGHGVDVRSRFRPSEWVQSRAALEHTIACTDFAITGLKLCQTESRLQLTVRPEWQLKAKPVRVREGNRDVAVIPDSVLTFNTNDGRRLTVVYEQDLGSEHRAKLSTKWHRLIAFARGPYQALGAQVITIAMLTPNEGRARQALSWLEQALREDQAEDLAAVFRVAGANPTTTPPHTLFLTPLWHVPLHQQQVALLEGLL
jgi:hypothetical protein